MMQYTHSCIQKRYSSVIYHKANIHVTVTQVSCDTPGRSPCLDLRVTIY